jgi:hypothetical protein
VTPRTDRILAVVVWLIVPALTIAMYAWLYGRAG